MSRSATWVIALVFVPSFVLLPASLVLALTLPAWGGFAVIGSMVLLWLVILAVLLEAYSKVTVGSDGVLIRRRFAAHFVPFRDIASVVEVDGVAIRMISHEGAVVDVYTGKDEHSTKPKYVEGCEQLFSRIQEGVARAQQDAVGIASDGREALRHRAYLALRGHEPAKRVAYRSEQPPDPVQLLRVVEDDRGAPTARAAAAVLARQHGDEQARTRIRVVADATANPRLAKLFRVAASEVEPSVVEEALEEVEREERAGHLPSGE